MNSLSFTIRKILKFAVISVLLLHVAIVHAGPEDPEEGGSWGPVIAWPHIAVSAANLPDGRVLTWSGSERDTWPSTEQTYSATFDPTNNQFVEIFHPTHNMFCAHLAMLEDGRVFVTGGRNQVNSPWTSIFDYRKDKWVQIENMATGGRWYPTTIALDNGDVMTAIGTATNPQYPDTWNIDNGWQIKNGIDFNDMVLDDYFSSGTHGESRWWPLLHVAPNGQVFHSGPTPKMHYIDPTGNGSYVYANVQFTDFYHKHGTTIMFDEGKLLTAGGWVSGTNTTSTNQAFTVDLNSTTPIVAATQSMANARKYHNGVMLPTGEVLVIGGNTSGQKFSDNGAVMAVEIWDPNAGANGQWRLGASMAVPRNYHSVALLLTDGRVLSAGSGYCSSSVTCNGSSHQDGQVYSPSYLFDNLGNPAVRPQITSGPGQVSSGQVFNVIGTPGLSRFTMIKMGSTTHGMNTDVRFINISFTETSAGNYSLTANNNQSVLTPGYWMLFGLDSNNVPTVAHVVLANSSGMPWIAAVSNQSSLVDSAVSLQVEAGDADNDALVYSALGLPPGLSINPVSGLITGAGTAEGNYQVTVSVTDNDEGSKNRTFTWTVFGQGLGTIRRDWWTGIGGTSISDLTGNANYPDTPSGVDFLNSFEAPTDWADNYGTRVHGFVTPGETGAFTFAIATDDAGELWLSTDASPSNKVLIANVPGFSASRQWDKYPEQQSAPISLVSGQTYYIEALQKEGGGGDNLSVAWQTPTSGTLDVIPGAFLSSANIAIGPTSESRLFTGKVENLGDTWTTITLPITYSDMVVVATPQYDAAAFPVVTRIRNASGNQFDIRVQNPSDTIVPSTYTVNYVVAEVGVYEDSGVRLEAAKFDSAVVDNASSWVGESRLYQHAYTAPVVFGQVMSDNDPRWSVFWASDGSAANPPSPSNISVGRHVGEDTDTNRASETIGYIVVDAGSGLIGDVPFEAATGPDVVLGIGDSPPYSYSLVGAADTAVLSSAGMDGANGGWPVLFGVDPLAANQISIAIDEDQIGDTERSHTAEQVAYASFADTPLVVNDIQTAPAETGEDVTITVIATGGIGLLYNWNFGDGMGDSGFGPLSEMTYSYAAPGRYVVTVTVRDPSTGEEVIETFVQVIHWPLTSQSPSTSSSVALNESLNQVWNVNPDNNTASVIDTATLLLAGELATGVQPVTVGIAPDGRAWVVNRKSASISVFDAATLLQISTIILPSRSQPEGLAFDTSANLAYVVLEATGDLLKLDATTGGVLDSVYLGKNPRHVSVSGDGMQVLVSRFITQPLPNESTIPIVESGGVFYGGEVLVINSSDLSVASTVTLRHSDRLVSEHSGPGVPNYLGPATISPDGRSAWVPSKQDNILAGGFRGGQGMTFDQTVRAISSKIDLLTNTEDFPLRIDHDNASVGTYSQFGPNGVYYFTALEGNREIAVSDVFTGTEIYRFDVGRAPQGIAISVDGTRLYVHNFMDRSVGIYDISAITQDNILAATEVATIATVQSEVLPATVLLGKQLFYDSRDPRLALNSYLSCASCHNDGGHDGRVWDITTIDGGLTDHEGVRNTISLQGRAAMTHGFLHWTSNFDEVQDFEGQIRALSGGTGLMDDADFFAGTTSDPLGDPKSGKSADLDALSAYLGSLDQFSDSPYRNEDGTLTPDGQLGRAVFEANNCASCHTPPNYTDSGNTILHDVGTITAASGKRLGGLLTGFDTPTLISTWNTAPYLHDGSAFDITEAVSAHNGIVLSATELNQLGAYLEQLDSVTTSLTAGCADCIAYWPFDEGSGSTASDMSGQGHQGTVIGAIWTTGLTGGALSFDGAGDFVQVPHAADISFTAADNYTVSAWVNVPSLPNSWSGVVTKSRDASPWYGIWISSANQWIYGGSTNINGSSVITGWHHVAIVQDVVAGQRRLYVDGVMDVIGTPTNSNGTGDLLIGSAAGGEDFAGVIDEVRIYDRNLSDVEINDLFIGWLPPVADAGPDQTLADMDDSGSESVTLDGSGSSDPDGSITNYRWTEGATELANGPSATAAVNLAVGAHAVTLEVTDNNAQTATDSVLITVDPQPPNSAPLVNAGLDLTVAMGEQLQINAATATDDGLPIPPGAMTILWTEEGTSVASWPLADQTSVVTHVVFSAVGSYVLRLTADDGVLSAFDEVTVTVSGDVDTPVMTPPGATYFGSQLVSLSTNTSATSIYYTLDGSDPSEASAPYTGSPISIAVDTTLKARAYKLGLNPSPVATANYLIQQFPVTGLIAYWPFDEGGGSFADDISIQNHQGTVNGATWTSGISGGALNFDGNDFVQVPHAADISFTASDSYTVSAWVNVPSLPSSWSGIVTKSRFTPPWYGMWISSSNQFVYAASNIYGSAVTAASWHHVAIVQDVAAGQRRLYVDGVLSASGTPIDSSGTGDLFIGSAGSAEYFTGLIDEVRIYNRNLSDSEIVAVSSLPPIADAGIDQTVADMDGSGSESVTLDGSGSTDPDGSITNYRWTAGATELANGPSATAAVSLPVGAHTVTLEVTDNDAQTATDTVLITVDPQPANSAPVVNAGSDLTVVMGEQLQINGATASDDGLPIPPGAHTVLWTEEGSSVASWPLADQTSVVTHVVFSAVGSYVLRLTADDSALSVFDELTVIVSGDVDTPVMTPPAGTYPDPQLVSLSTTTSGTSIYYTLDGSDPTESSTPYTGSPISIAVDTTFKARAYKTGLNASAIATASYLIQQVTANGLIAYWPFDEGSGTIADDMSSLNHQGTVNGATWTAGVSGGALSFDGAGDYVQVPHAADISFTSADSFTVSAWVNVPGLASSWSGVVTKSRDVAPWYGIWISSPNRWIYGGSTNINGSAVTTGWHHIVVVQDVAAGQRRLYVDGVLDVTGTPTSANGTGDLLFGTAAGGEDFSGLIDEVRIYDRNLLDAEILDLANQFTP